MGLFSKKKKTKVETKTTTVAESKIVKLSYIETIALDGGLGDIKDLAGETAAKSSSIDTSKDSKDKIQKFADSFSKGSLQAGVSGLGVGVAVGSFAASSLGLNTILASLGTKALGGLFGKKVSTDTKTTIKDSGWSVSKFWKQPQFDVIRYAIGIKELSVVLFKYEQVSEIISKPWTSPKEISEVVLYVDQYIPKEFPASNNYIEYYVKPDIEDANWVRINGLGLPTVFNPDNSIVPRIISFNTEKPINSNLEESYIFTDSPVKSIRFKAVLRRPDTTESGLEAVYLTPILKSYKLLMTPKNGL